MPYLDYGVSIPEIGGEANTWGTKFNDKTFPMLLRLMRGYRSVAVSGNTSIVYTNGDLAANGSAGYILLADSALAGIPIITFPGVENLCFLKNGSATYAMTLTAGGNTVSLAAGRTVLFICDGTTVAIWDPTAESASSAAAAGVSATSAASSAGTATTQKDLATAQKTYAQEWAQNPEDDAVSVAAGGDNVTTFSALHWAAKAENQAIIASAQAALAAGYAASIDPSTLQPKDATLTSLSGLTLVAGDVLYSTGPDTLQRLAKGTTLQQLRMNAGATAPEWADPATAGAWTQIGATVTLSGTSVTFLSIPTTYAEIMLEVLGMSHNNGATASYALAISTDNFATNGSLTMTGGGANTLIINGAIYFPSYRKDTSGIHIMLAQPLVSPALNAITVGNPVSMVAAHTGGINAIRITLSAGSFDAGTMKLWGR